MTLLNLIRVLLDSEYWTLADLHDWTDHLISALPEPAYWLLDLSKADCIDLAISITHDAFYIDQTDLPTRSSSERDFWMGLCFLKQQQKPDDGYIFRAFGWFDAMGYYDDFSIFQKDLAEAVHCKTTVLYDLQLLEPIYLMENFLTLISKN